MEKEDIYIKEAVNILKQNNSYFKKVYANSSHQKIAASSPLDENGRFPYSFVIELLGKKYFFKIYLGKEDSSFIKSLDTTDGLKRTLGPQFSEPQPNQYDIKLNDGNPYSYDEIFQKIESIVRSVPPTTQQANTSQSTNSESTQNTSTQNAPKQDKVWAIYKFTVKDKTSDSYEKIFITAPTDQSVDEYKLLLEFYGWSVLNNHIVLAKSANIQDLYDEMPDNTANQKIITPKTIEVAPGSRIKNYLLKFIWGTDNNRQTKTFLTKSTFMEEKSISYIIENYLINKLTGDQKAKFINLDYQILRSQSQLQGSLEFNAITPAILDSDPIGLENPVSYRISFFDIEGNQHEIFTVKSTVPLDEYVEKLRMNGFHNIEFDLSKKPGNIDLEKINPDLKSPKQSPTKFKKTVDKFKKFWASNSAE